MRRVGFSNSFQAALLAAKQGGAILVKGIEDDGEDERDDEDDE